MASVSAMAAEIEGDLVFQTTKEALRVKRAYEMVSGRLAFKMRTQ